MRRLVGVPFRCQARVCLHGNGQPTRGPQMVTCDIGQARRDSCYTEKLRTQAHSRRSSALPAYVRLTPLATNGGGSLLHSVHNPGDLARAFS
jgi:hypothetical protein